MEIFESLRNEKRKERREGKNSERFYPKIIKISGLTLKSAILTECVTYMLLCTHISKRIIRLRFEKQCVLIR